MKRVLIFLFLFPAVATVSFYAVLYVLTGAVVDSLSGPGIMYLVSIGPGLVLALVDWLVAKTPIPAASAQPSSLMGLWFCFGLGTAALKTFLRSVLSAQSQPRCVRGCRVESQMAALNE
jgi:hypothetical protein